MKKCLLFLLLFCLCGCSKEKVHTFSGLPEYKGSINVQHHIDQPAKGANSLTYEVNISFPASDLTTFVDNNLKANGFLKFKMPFGSSPERLWLSFDESTAEWNKPQDRPPARYLASWANSRKDEVVWLVVEFNPYRGGDNWKTKALASLHIAKLSALQEEAEQLKKIRITN